VLTDTAKDNSFEYKNYKKNDVVFTEGMIADGFYIVQNGKFINTYKKTENGKVFNKIYNKGDHFGSRVILQGGRRTGTITALEDSEVLKIDLESFKLMASNLPALKRYFSDYLPKNFNNIKLKN
jgi:CRP/FNR family transcriptional regulator